MAAPNRARLRLRGPFLLPQRRTDRASERRYPRPQTCRSGDTRMKYLLDLGTRSQVLTRVKIEFRY